MTYVDMNGNFGALGHGISDSDTGELVDIEGGELYETRSSGSKKARPESGSHVRGDLLRKRNKTGGSEGEYGRGNLRNRKPAFLDSIKPMRFPSASDRILTRELRTSEAMCPGK